MTVRIFYGFIIMEENEEFNDFILEESTDRGPRGQRYHYMGHWKHSGCYWMVLE